MLTTQSLATHTSAVDHSLARSVTDLSASFSTSGRAQDYAARYASAHDDLSQLNAAFLSFAFNADWFPETLAKRCEQASAAQLDRIAGLPFSLFEFELTNVEIWREHCDSPNESPVPSGRLGPLHALSTDILSYAWHLSRCDTSTSGRLLLGLSSTVAMELKRVAPSRLSSIALRAQCQLRPRWLEHSRFWGALFDSVATPNEWHRIQLWGRQLMAAERVITPQSSNTFNSRVELKGRLRRCS